MDVKPHNTLEEIDELIVKSKDADPRILRRYKGIRLVMLGKNGLEAAKTLGVSRHAVRDWVNQYNDSGIPGLQGKALTSPIRGFSEQTVIECVKEFIAENQGRVTLEDITSFIQERYNPDATEESIYPVIRRLGFYSETVWTHKSLAPQRTR